MNNADLARNLAKWVVMSLVNVQTTKFTANTIADNTRFEKDNTVVMLGSGALGMVVAAKLQPVTDKMVDKTADFLVDQRDKRQAKKDAKKKDQE